MFRQLALAVAIVVALPALASPQEERKDLQVFKDVASSVTSYARFTVFDDISIDVDQGVVTLTGKVTMPYKVQEIEKRAARVKGVRQVVNKIKVLPVSIFDEDLRYAISRAIYGNPSFWHYAAMVNPPIHIVVEGGHVTLVGVVNNNVERMLARTLASSFGAFSVTNELKTDAEVKAVLEKM